MIRDYRRATNQPGCISALGSVPSAAATAPHGNRKKHGVTGLRPPAGLMPVVATAQRRRQDRQPAREAPGLQIANSPPFLKQELQAQGHCHGKHRSRRTPHVRQVLARLAFTRNNGRTISRFTARSRRKSACDRHLPPVAAEPLQVAGREGLKGGRHSERADIGCAAPPGVLRPGIARLSVAESSPPRH